MKGGEKMPKCEIIAIANQKGGVGRQQQHLVLELH